MINKWNAFKEKISMSVAYLLPRPVAYWTFIRVATFECVLNPASQQCHEAAKRWKDPEAARATIKHPFSGPAFNADASELLRRKDSSNADPVHECLGFWWFWDESWTDRIGPYETDTQARKAAVAYGEWLQAGSDPNASLSIEFEPLPMTDPRHPLNMDFASTTDGTAWAKAFLNHVALLGSDIATDQGCMITWFSNAIMRGYDAGNPTTVTISAGDAKSIMERGPEIAQAIIDENQE